MTETEADGRYSNDQTYVSGYRDDCSENLDQEVVDYFSNENQRHIAAKTEYLEAKSTYNGDESTRSMYSESLKCLPLMFEGSMTEDELHSPANYDTNEVPFLPLPSVPVSKTVSIPGNSGGVKIPNTAGVSYQNWVITGLYAPPGKIVTVVSPARKIGQIKVQIGAHTDKLYGKEPLLRDPQISYSFDITQATQKVGSPYGGLIIVRFTGPDNLSGDIFDIQFDNVVEAPHFILGQHTDEDWNNHIKNRPAPWAVFEIPNAITFVVAARAENKKGAKIPESVTPTLEEWKEYMKRQDKAAGVEDRPVAEILVLDSQISMGSMHSGYPMMAKLNAVNQIFPPDGRSIDSTVQSVGIGHEIGHNMRKQSYYLNHVTVNMFFFYSLPGTRFLNAGTWGRGSRIFSYIKSGQPNIILDNGNFDIWTDIMRIPLDGLDGSGWTNDGSWADFPEIIASYKDLPREELPDGMEEMTNLWVKKICEVKQMNMIKYFEFWQFPLTPSTTEVCNQYTEEPMEMLAWIADIKHVAEDVDGCQEGWYGYANKCFKLSEERVTYDGAEDYCNTLGGGASLAALENWKDALLADWTFFNSEITRPFWVKEIPNHAEIFPQAEDYEVDAGLPTSLETPDKRPKCHYGASLQALGGRKQRCLSPVNAEPSKQFPVLCETNQN